MSTLIVLLVVGLALLNIKLVKELNRERKLKERAIKRGNSYKNKMVFSHIQKADIEEQLNKTSVELKNRNIHIDTLTIERDNAQRTLDMFEHLLSKDKSDIQELVAKNRELKNDVNKYVYKIKEKDIALGKCYF